MTNTITVLGSTGSIGRQTLQVAQALSLSVAALSADRNVARMEAQCRRFHPRLAAMSDTRAAEELKTRLADMNITVLSGEQGIVQAAAAQEAETVVVAVTGFAALRPTLAAIREGKRIALANKESMVCAGHLMQKAAREHGAQIIPVDSEHSAVFQCLMGCQDMEQVRRLILTCSGGPFYGWTREALASVRAEDALRHPTWRMGPKITVDCATLMNKGLEVIEAMHLYAMPLEKIDVAIHRQSIVHSLVEFCDGAIMAQLGMPDMRIPIQLALTYPDRLPCPAPALDLFSCAPMSFSRPDTETFGCLKLAIEAARRGGTACAVMNGANEAAVGLCLKGEIGLAEIETRVRRAMDAVPVTDAPSLEDILEADRLARAAVLS